MFCMKCGKEMEQSAAFCPYCGEKVMVSTSGGTEQAAEEVIIKEGLCNRVKSKFNVQNGHGMLTNKRFVYSKHSLASVAAMGVLVNLTKGKYDFEIPLADITGMREGKQGISKTIILTTRNGEEYNFYFNNREEWEREFQKMIFQ